MKILPVLLVREIDQQLSLHTQHLAALVSTAAWHDFQISLEYSTGQLNDQMSAMESTLQQTLSQQAAFNDLFQHKIDATLYSASVVESTTSVTAKQIEQMDERLAQLQLLVKASIDTKHHCQTHLQRRQSNEGDLESAYMPARGDSNSLAATSIRSRRKTRKVSVNTP
jgi:hypothetical protein